jgi:hypothetical protein
MSSQGGSSKRVGIFLPPGEGSSYPMGRISAVFKADGEETQRGYSISEWWLEPHTQGPGAHSHAEDEDDIFSVVEGTMSFLIGDRWIEAPRVPSYWHRVECGMISRTDVQTVPVSLTLRSQGILRRRCRRSSSGLPRIPEGRLTTAWSRRAEPYGLMQSRSEAIRHVVP